MNNTVNFIVVLCTALAFLDLFPLNESKTETTFEILECLELDSVPGDFPVSFAFIEKDQWQFVAYYNKTRNMTVASRKVSEDKWNYKILPTKVGWDSHNSIRMTIDRENCIHVAGNMHNDTMTYFKTEKPLDISSFQRVFPLVSEEDELRCTYPSFIRKPDGELIFSYRLGGSGNGITITNTYNEKTKAFKRLTDKPMFDGLNQMSAYASGPRLGPDGWYHLIWLWRDTPHCETNHDPSYARSKDLINWETIEGTKFELPITPDSKQFIIDPVPAEGGVINGAYRLFFDKEKKPMLAYMKYDKIGNNQIFVAKAEKGSWAIQQVSDWKYRWEFSGPGSIDFQIKLKNAYIVNDSLIIEYWHINRGHGELAINSTNMKLIKDEKVEQLITHQQYPEHLLAPLRSDGIFQVHWLKSNQKNNENFYVLRWETMGKRRFYKAPDKPVEPSPLILYKLKKSN